MGHLFYYYAKPCASFQSHKSIQTGVTVRKRSIWVKIVDFLSRATLKNNRAPLLCHELLCSSFHNHQWTQTVVTVRKRPIRVKIDDFMSRVTLKFDRWPWKKKKNRTTLLCYFKPCATFRSHQWIPTWVIARKRSMWVKTSDFFVPCDIEIWHITLKNNRANQFKTLRIIS